MALLLNAGDTVSRSYSYTQPSPLHPSQPQGTGERTANLSDLYNVDVTQVNLRVTTGNNMKIVVNGTKSNGNNVISIKTPNIVLPAGTYTLSIKMVGGEIKNSESGAFFGINRDTYSQRTSPPVARIGDVGKRTLNLTSDTLISSFDITPSYGDTGSIWENAEFECMLYSGSDSIDYDPYGYKIPISSAGQTTPVYLGEVETTRKIRKLVLDGTENFVGENYIYAWTLTGIVSGYYQSFCNVYSHRSSYADIYGTNNTFAISNTRLLIHDNRYTTAADFKAYLAQQYAAGTPVTVWYVLATPTTAVVNEPLMRIGDYADTLSNVSIPVTAGGDTISVGTTVQPSEVTVNYKGWHPVTDVHERENGAWT